MTVYEFFGTLILMVLAFLILALIWKITDALDVGEKKKDKKKTADQ